MIAALVLSLLLAQQQTQPEPRPTPPPQPPASTGVRAGVGTGMGATGEVIAEVRVHGNYATPDAEVLRLAGIVIGEPLQPDSLQRITKRLHDSGRFQQVDVRKRYRSLTDTQQVVLILLVQEQPAAVETPGIANPLLRPFRRLHDQMQFLPILNYADGYGFTYGLRTSFANSLGRDSRISVPLTLGAYKRAAIEADKSFEHGVVNRIEGAAEVSVHENPFFREDDGRRLVRGRAERQLAPQLKLGGQLGVTHVNFSRGQSPCDMTRAPSPPGTCEANFEPAHDTFATYGADLTFDTRRDPVFPRNAIFASVGWDALNFTGATPTVNRARTDLRGYIGLIGQSVVSVRARLDTSDGPLPPYERWLLGGSSSLRGFRTGTFAGDNRALVGLELRVPLSSPLGVSRAGVSAFVDSGAVYDHGVHLRDANFHQGTGAGVFLLAPFIQLNLDVAYGFGNRLRVHFTTGFQF